MLWRTLWLSIRAIQHKVKALEYKVDNAKNRNQINSLRIIGLAEGVEGQNLTVFVEDLLPDAHFSPYYAVERAHRVPLKPNPMGDHPVPLFSAS